MREKFELYCKVVGLVFFCFGIIGFLFAIVFFIMKPDAAQMIPESARALYSQSQIDQLQNASSYTLNRYLLMLIILGIMEMLLGVYLMKSNNLFIKCCYPSRCEQTAIDSPKDIELKTNIEEKQNQGQDDTETKYAPPGYFKE